MSLGLGLSLGVSANGRTFLDTDAMSYFSRAGIASGTISVPVYDSRNLLSNTTTAWSAAPPLNGTQSQATGVLDPFDGSTAVSKFATPSGPTLATRRVGHNGVPGLSVTSGQSYTFSVYVKPLSARYVSLQSTGGGYGNVAFDLQLGTIITNSTSTARSITPVGNGWYRLTATGTTTVATGVYIYLALCTSAGASTNAVAGSGLDEFYYWGPQYELGTSATTYIPTSANPVFGTAGNITVNPRTQINDFIKGVKALGIWNNFVCWSLRSFQNKGSGSTFSSFGGLGSYDASVVNGGTWTTSGILSTTSNVLASTSLAYGLLSLGGSSAYTVGGVSSASPSPTSGNFFAIAGGHSNGNNLIGSANGNPTNGTIGAYVPSVGFSTGLGNWHDTNTNFVNPFAFAAVSKTGNTWDSYVYAGASKQTKTQTTSGGTDQTGTLRVGGSGGPAGQTLAFNFAINSYINSTTLNGLYDLYKATIGTGLPLV